MDEEVIRKRCAEILSDAPVTGDDMILYRAAYADGLDAARQALAQLERELRQRMWTMHYSRLGHTPYGDDGCLDCNTCGRDYAATPLDELRRWELLDGGEIISMATKQAQEIEWLQKQYALQKEVADNQTWTELKAKIERIYNSYRPNGADYGC